MAGLRGLQAEMLFRQPANAVGTVQVAPFGFQDVNGHLVAIDLRMSLLEPVLQVLHLVFHVEEEQRHDCGDG